MINNNNMIKAGFIALVGLPNAGKSTLLNLLIEDKVAPISSKPQTSRRNIKGIFTDVDAKAQIICIDTPGFHNINKMLNFAMNDQIFSSLESIDTILFITDGSLPLLNEEINFIKKIFGVNKPIICLLNKADLTINEDKKKTLHTEFSFAEFIEISLLDSSFIPELRKIIIKYLPTQNDYFYSPEIVSDLTERNQVEEILQEKLFRLYHQEIPYSTYVEVLSFDESDETIIIHANICCEKESQKPIIIGSQGSMIKKLRLSSQKTLKNLFEKSITLHLYVKVVKLWSKNPSILKELGFNQAAIKKFSKK